MRASALRVVFLASLLSSSAQISMAVRIFIPLCSAGTLRAFDLRVVGGTGTALSAASELNASAGAARHFQAVPGSSPDERVLVVALVHTREAFAALLATLAQLIRGSSTLAIIPGSGWRLASAAEASAALWSAVEEQMLASNLSGSWRPALSGGCRDMLAQLAGGGSITTRLQALRLTSAPRISAGSTLTCTVSPIVLARLREPPELAPLLVQLAQLCATECNEDVGISFDPFPVAAAPDFATGLLCAIHPAQPQDADQFDALCSVSALPPYLSTPGASPALVGEVHLHLHAALQQNGEGGAGVESSEVRFVPLSLIFAVGAFLAPAGAALGAEIAGAFAASLQDAVSSLRALLVSAPSAPTLERIVDEAAATPSLDEELPSPQAPSAPPAGQQPSFAGWQTALELERGGVLSAAADEAAVKPAGPTSSPAAAAAHVRARPTVRVELPKAKGGEAANAAVPPPVAAPRLQSSAASSAVKPPFAKPTFGTFAKGKVAGVTAAPAPPAGRPKQAPPALAPPPSAAKEAETTKKRKPPSEADQAISDADVLRLHSTGMLGTLSVPALKAYLRAHKVPGGLSGVKAVLVERIAAHLASAAGAARK